MTDEIRTVMRSPLSKDLHYIILKVHHTVAWVTWPERPKGEKNKIKLAGPKGPKLAPILRVMIYYEESLFIRPAKLTFPFFSVFGVYNSHFSRNSELIIMTKLPSSSLQACPSLRSVPRKKGGARDS